MNRTYKCMLTEFLAPNTRTRTRKRTHTHTHAHAQLQIRYIEMCMYEMTRVKSRAGLHYCVLQTYVPVKTTVYMYICIFIYMYIYIYTYIYI